MMNYDFDFSYFTNVDRSMVIEIRTHVRATENHHSPTPKQPWNSSGQHPVCDSFSMQLHSVQKRNSNILVLDDELQLGAG